MIDFKCVFQKLLYVISLRDKNWPLLIECWFNSFLLKRNTVFVSYMLWITWSHSAVYYLSWKKKGLNSVLKNVYAKSSCPSMYCTINIGDSFHRYNWNLGYVNWKLELLWHYNINIGFGNIQFIYSSFN